MTIRKPLDVRLVKSSLIATFANANPPLIWRFDLERNHSFTLALQGDDHEWELGVTSVKGEFHPVVRFADRAEAEEAFATVSRVLANRKEWGALRFLKILGIAILAAIALMLAYGYLRSVAYAPPGQPVQQQSYKVPPPPPAPAQGVPMPADEVLKPPAQ